MSPLDNQKERCIRFYRWALRDFQREIDHDYPFLRTIQSVPAQAYLRTIEPLSRDEQVAIKYEADPLVHNKISLHLLYNAIQYGKLLIGKGYRINIPLLLMHGTSDKITFCKSSELFVRNTGKFTKYKFWSNGMHELHNDIIKDEVFEFILNWLKTVLPPT